MSDTGIPRGKAPLGDRAFSTSFNIYLDTDTSPTHSSRDLALSAGTDDQSNLKAAHTLPRTPRTTSSPTPPPSPPSSSMLLSSLPDLRRLRISTFDHNCGHTLRTSPLPPLSNSPRATPLRSPSMSPRTNDSDRSSSPRQDPKLDASLDLFQEPIEKMSSRRKLYWAQQLGLIAARTTCTLPTHVDTQLQKAVGSPLAWEHRSVERFKVVSPENALSRLGAKPEKAYLVKAIESLRQEVQWERSGSVQLWLVHKDEHDGKMVSNAAKSPTSRCGFLPGGLKDVAEAATRADAGETRELLGEKQGPTDVQLELDKDHKRANKEIDKINKLFIPTLQKEISQTTAFSNLRQRPQLSSTEEVAALERKELPTPKYL